MSSVLCVPRGDLVVEGAWVYESRPAAKYQEYLTTLLVTPARTSHNVPHCPRAWLFALPYALWLTLCSTVQC